MKRGEYASTSSIGPIPRQDIKRGQSLYLGIGGNRASQHLGPDVIAAGLEKEKAKNERPQVSREAARESRFAEYQLQGNTPHTIVKHGEGYYRVNEIGAIGGDPMTLDTAEKITNKQTGELMPMYKLQYKPGKDQIQENLLNPGTLPYIPGNEETSPGPNASAQVAPLSTEVAMNRDRVRSQPAVINLPIPGSQDGAVPKQDTVQHAPASLVPDWLHTTAT